MKKIILILAIFLAMAIPSFAYTGTLSTPQTLQLSDAVSLDWEFSLGSSNNAITGRHRWRDENNAVMYMPNSGVGGWIRWTLRNYTIDSVPDVTNTDCTGSGVPDACCTDIGVGTCDDMIGMVNSACEDVGDPKSCCTGLDEGVCQGWSDTIMFDCGTSACDGYVIGIGLRTLIINQWKKVFCPGCTITF